MKTLMVYADFDWLKIPELIGTLGYESLRGSDSYSFRYDEKWLQKHGSTYLSEDLSNYPGLQYTVPGKDIFVCFSDALPDRWGRTLINRREQIKAKEEKRDIRRLSSFDYLTGIDDYTRTGAFRFKEKPDGDYINCDNRLKIPPLTELNALITASEAIEQSEAKNELPDKKWIQQLLHPGTSLGGARPKAVVTDNDKNLFMAKFPSKNDNYDVAIWEHLCHILAKKAGINTAETKAVSCGNKYHTLLSRRFDRTDQKKRIHFASAMTLLGFTDGCNANSNNGYLDIVDIIIQKCYNVEENLKELFRRAAFNIAVGNTDDHFRNHGFLLCEKGWTLSPAYDMNPTNIGYQSILITKNTNESRLDLLLDSSDDYMINKETAKQIICNVIESVKTWESTAIKLSIAKKEIEQFSGIFNKNLNRKNLL